MGRSFAHFKVRSLSLEIIAFVRKPRFALESLLIGGRQMLVKHHINANERD